VDHVAVPCIVTAFLFIALSLQGLGHPTGDFHGKASLVELADGVFATSFCYRDCFLNESAGCYHPWLSRVGYWTALLIFYTSLAAAAVLFYRRTRRWVGALDSGLVSSATLAAAALLVIASSLLIGTPYHGLRRALFFVFLAEMCLLAVCRWLCSWRGWVRAVAWIWSGGLAALALAMFLQFDTRYYVEWRFDAGNREIINRIRAVHGDSHAPARMVASFPLHWALEVYRQMYGLRWLAPVEHVKLEKGFDYYVLRMDDSHYIQDLGLRKILVDEVSGTVLAVP
jgi:hypothetical protein